MELFEHTPESLESLADEIAALGYSQEQASTWAIEIGDTPVLDTDGNILVTGDNGSTVKLRLKSFDDC
jgi:hypothetical protein